jgi:POT family proton-dependent oligopeptide transporter
MTVGHFFFTPAILKQQEANLATTIAVNLATSGLFLGLGLWLFAQRQREQPDDGFLAITLYSLKQWLTGNGRPASGDHPLARSTFWGPAVERYGGAATEGPVAVFKIVSVFFLVSVFWALFDQKATTWLRQAQDMDLGVLPGSETKLRATQTIAANPLLVMILIPLLNLVYRRIEKRGIKVKPLWVMTVGMFITSLSFVATAILQEQINIHSKGTIWVGWQLIQYVLLTVGEVMVSVTGLEFAYTQAPRRMKSTVMGFWTLTVSLGNVLVVMLVGFKGMDPARSFWIFAGMMVAAAALFGLRAYYYVPKDYTQG